MSRKYPYPYGFVLDTTAEDGDNIDVFVITNQPLKRGEIVDCEVFGLMEQFEKSWEEANKDQEEVDHNLLAYLSGEQAILFNSASGGIKRGCL